MEEMKPIDALRKANEQMDAVYDDGYYVRWLPDVISEVDMHEAEADPTRVLVEHRGDGAIVLTVMNEDGFRVGDYGTIYPFELAEALGL